ncbi:MAG TPA: pyridoxamine 5'-phosphate oxidase [Tepidisphaeraceae bacterium]|nr:pyridoxamine 5'-phosphate oxidase [Tepidisphaeraceae bacterium]
MATNLTDIRRSYEQGALHRSDLDPDPIKQFEKWLDDAIAAEHVEATAMFLATASNDGRPSGRVVLLKRVGTDGFVFFTNYHSHKGQDLESNPQAEGCFFWDKLERTVRVYGRVTRASVEESEEYFHKRPRLSQIGALASNQSQPVDSREVLETQFADLEKLYEKSEIPRPPHWGGYVIAPETIEFWQGRPSRLHDRLLYVKSGNAWKIERLSP